MDMVGKVEVDIDYCLVSGGVIVFFLVVGFVKYYFVDYFYYVIVRFWGDQFIFYLGEGKDGFMQGKGECWVDFQNGEVVVDQCMISLVGLVVGRVCFVDYWGVFDSGGECFCFLWLVMNDLCMVEFYVGLYDDGDNLFQCGVEFQFMEGGFMGFECCGGILCLGDMYVVDGVGFVVGNWNFGFDDVGQVVFLFIVGGFFGSLIQVSGVFSNYIRIQWYWIVSIGY